MTRLVRLNQDLRKAVHPLTNISSPTRESNGLDYLFVEGVQSDWVFTEFIWRSSSELSVALIVGITCDDEECIDDR